MVVNGIPRYRIGREPMLIPRETAASMREVTFGPAANREDFVALICKPEITANLFNTPIIPWSDSTVPLVKTTISSAKLK